MVLDVSDGVLGGGGRFALEIRDGRAQLRSAPTPSPTCAPNLSVLGSLYLGVHRASAFAAVNRLRCNDSEIGRRSWTPRSPPTSPPSSASASSCTAQAGWLRKCDDSL